jgi:hypothetical protein
MKKFLIPVIGAAFAFSPVVVPAMFATAPAHAQAKAKAAKAKAKNPWCAVPRPDTHQESWATAYGCWGQPAKLDPMMLAGRPQAFAPPPAAPAPAFVGGPGYNYGGPGFVGAPGVVGRPVVGARPAARRAAVRARAR